MIADILHPTFYESKDKDDLAYALHKAGLFNLGEMLKNLYIKIDDLKVELEKAKEECYDEGYSCGLDNAEDRDNEKAKDFANWFLREFEPKSKKKIKSKLIGTTEFIIMTAEDYNDLKAQFHSMCD